MYFISEKKKYVSMNILNYKFSSQIRGMTLNEDVTVEQGLDMKKLKRLSSNMFKIKKVYHHCNKWKSKGKRNSIMPIFSKKR